MDLSSGSAAAAAAAAAADTDDDVAPLAVAAVCAESPHKLVERQAADGRSSISTTASALSVASSEDDTLLSVLVHHAGSEYCSSAALSSYGSVASDLAVAALEAPGAGPAPTGRRGRCAAVSSGILVSAVANLSTAYNLAVINYAMIMIRQSHPPSSPELSAMVASCSLAGAILGQLTFGYVGALLGRKRAMVLTLLLSVAGAAASAVLPWGDALIYETLALCRFVLGLGVGGVYPLSATAAAESSSDAATSSKRVATVFSFQGVGQLLAPLMAYLLLDLQLPASIGWRILLGVGALPGLVVLRQAFRAQEDASAEFAGKAQLDHPPLDLWSTLARDEGLRRKFVGAAAGWFLFDISFYGNVIFTPIILADTLGFDQSHLASLALCALLVAAIGLPGYYVTIACVGRLSFRSIQMLGFSMMAALFLVLGAFYSQLLPYRALLLTLYALTFFFSNFGPNVSTFSLPAEIFPADVRVKLNGFAAAAGKLGATLGAAAFGLIEEDWGVSRVLIASALVSLLGVLVTHRYIPLRP